MNAEQLTSVEQHKALAITEQMVQIKWLEDNLSFENKWRKQSEQAAKRYSQECESLTKTLQKIVLRAFPHDEPYQAWMTVDAIARATGLRTTAEINALYGLLGQLESEYRITRIRLQHGDKLVELFAIADMDNETITRSEDL